MHDRDKDELKSLFICASQSITDNHDLNLERLVVDLIARMEVDRRQGMS